MSRNNDWVVKRRYSFQLSFTLYLNLDVPEATCSRLKWHVLNLVYKFASLLPLIVLRGTLRVICNLNTLVFFRVIKHGFSVLIRNASQIAYISHIGRDVGHWQAETIAHVFKLKFLTAESP